MRLRSEVRILRITARRNRGLEGDAQLGRPQIPHTQNPERMDQGGRRGQTRGPGGSRTRNGEGRAAGKEGGLRGLQPIAYDGTEVEVGRVVVFVEHEICIFTRLSDAAWYPG